MSDEDNVAALIQKFTIPGTPLVMYGDEIALTGSGADRGVMLWDDGVGHGFTEKKGWQPDESQKGMSSVLVSCHPIPRFLLLPALSINHLYDVFYY